MIKSKIISLTVLLLVGCSSSDFDYNLNSKYEVVSFDDEHVEGYDVIVLKNEKREKIVLLSVRLGSGVDKPPFEKYEDIKEGEKYKLTLVPQDSVYVVTQHYVTPYPPPYKIYLGDILFIENDTIKTKIYRSKDVFDRFVKKK